MAREPILIVDDNAQNLKLARVILAAEGYDVRTAIDAEDALRVLETFTPRLILMDLQLPKMDGLTLTRQLKADPKRRGVIIIALTAYAMKGDDKKALPRGATAIWRSRSTSTPSRASSLDTSRARITSAVVGHDASHDPRR